MADSGTMFLTEEEGYMKHVAGPEGKFVMYHCRKNTMFKFAVLLPDDEMDAEGDGKAQSYQHSLSSELTRYRLIPTRKRTHSPLTTQHIRPTHTQTPISRRRRSQSMAASRHGSTV